MATLSELLNNKKLNMLNLIAGKTGISRNITGAIMLDNPEMVEWMRNGEILLTTGYLLKDDPKIQNQLISDLSKSNAGALVLKLRRYFETIPNTMLKKANELNFPLLEIPYYMSLSELSEIINKHIYFSENGINNPKKNISELLFKAVESNANINAILNISESFTQNAFLLLDNNMKTINFSNSFLKYSHLIPESKNLFFSPENTKKYINQFTTETGTSYIHLNLNNLINDTHSILCPIKSDKILLGYLLCISDKNISSKTGAALVYNKIIFALSILLLKERTSFEFKNRKYDMFIESLLNDEILSDTKIEKISTLYSLPLESSYVCCIVSFTKLRKINYAHDWIGVQTLKRKQIIACWNRHSTSICKLFLKDNNIIIFLQTDKNINSMTNLVKDFCHDINLLLIENGFEEDILIGIGNTTHGLKNLHNSYYQAKKAIETMLHSNKQKIICTFDECLIYQLINSSEYIKRTLKEKLFPLINYDKINNTQLLLTFESYLNNNQNVTLTSKSLFIHRNTLYYRLEKIVDILNIDFNYYDSILIYQLAIEALK